MNYVLDKQDLIEIKLLLSAQEKELIKIVKRMKEDDESYEDVLESVEESVFSEEDLVEHYIYEKYDDLSLKDDLWNIFDDFENLRDCQHEVVHNSLSSCSW